MKIPEVNDALGLGTILGRKQVLGLLAGKCSAADVQCLREMRNGKQYRSLGMTWDQFCRKHLGISRGWAEKMIGLLEKFGPQYLEALRRRADHAGNVPAARRIRY